MTWGDTVVGAPIVASGLILLPCGEFHGLIESEAPS